MAKLANGCKKRSDGRIESRFYIDGKRYSVYGRTTKEVRENEIKKRAEIKRGAYKKNSDITLDQYFEEWVAARRGTVSPATAANVKCCYRKYSEHIGKVKIRKLEKRQILSARNTLMETMKVGSINKATSILKSILTSAVDDEIIEKNPAAKIHRLKDNEPSASETIHRAFTKEEQAAFMKASEDNYYYPLFCFLLSTGIRIGEAAALLWTDIDLKKGVVHIRRTMTRDEGGHTVLGLDAKTKSGKRDIPLISSAKKALKEQKKMQMLLFGDQANENPDYVFTNNDCSFVRTVTINENIERLCRKTNIEKVTVHAFRDTFATRAIEAGMNPNTLKEILGHTDISITMNLYAHVLPNTKKEEMCKLDSMI